MRAKSGKTAAEPTKEKKDNVQLLPPYVWIWNEYWTLSAQRQHSGAGMQKISMTDVYSYMKMVGGYTQSELKLFITCMVEMDEILIGHLNAQKDKTTSD